MVSRDLVGRIMLDRKIINWRWYDDANTSRVFIHLLLCAVFVDELPYHDTVLKKGQWLTTRKQLSSELGISEQAVRTALKHLESTGEITTKLTNNKTLITVENYEFYQDKSTVANQRSTNDQPTTNQLNNNANNVIYSADAAEGGGERTKDTLTEQAKEVVDYFNEKCGTKYRYSKTTLTPIKARLKDFTVDDCKTVIDTKAEEWSGDKEMSKYLRPSTLFREGHFEEYLNQVSKTKVEKEHTLSEEQIMAINWEE